VFIAINRYARVQRRRLTFGLMLTALCVTVAMAHGAVAGLHLGPDGAEGQPVGTVLAVCFVIAETAAILVAGAALLAILTRLRLPSFVLLIVRLTSQPRREPLDLRARSSPVRLQVMRR